MKKRGLCLCAGLFFVLAFSVPVFACVGARPMAMGGAFIAVSDDANATYWNPAGLAQKEIDEENPSPEFNGKEFTYTPTIANRDEMNYDDYLSMISPLNINGHNFGVLGFSIINSGYDTYYWQSKDYSFGLSYGKKIGYGLSLGINLSYRTYKETVKAGYGLVYPIGVVWGPASQRDTFFAIDPALFWQTGKFSFGVLYQNVNEPEADIFGINYIWIKNLRMGAAYRPDDKTVISLDIYDITDESEGLVDRDLRIGVERWFDFPAGKLRWLGESVALRAGGYNINSSDGAYTFGFGLKSSPEEKFPRNIQLDYTVIVWKDVPSGVDKLTHQLGFTFKF